ncbi:MAG: hypothetical protein Q8Q94_00905 [bacterium]|nr:hypothetical protein [bacterium]MDZ4299996.1 hypothetical protein [Candidatus Sungbacteria bacterium]
MDTIHTTNSVEGVEIERKWRLFRLPPREILGKGYMRCQGYLIVEYQGPLKPLMTI